jgi:hypothetical protein
MPAGDSRLQLVPDRQAPRSPRSADTVGPITSTRDRPGAQGSRLESRDADVNLPPAHAGETARPGAPSRTMRARPAEPVEAEWPRSFRHACCDWFGCTEAGYESALFWQCLFRHALPIAWIIRRFEPGFFREDFDLIHEVGAMTRPEIFRSEVNYFYGRNLRCKRWLRRVLRVRISGGRLLRLQRQLFPRPRSRSRLTRVGVPSADR